MMCTYTALSVELAKGCADLRGQPAVAVAAEVTAAHDGHDGAGAELHRAHVVRLRVRDVDPVPVNLRP